LRLVKNWQIRTVDFVNGTTSTAQISFAPYEGFVHILEAGT